MRKTRVALYPRVSTQEQAREGYSIGEQIERLTKYAEAMGWEIYKVYTEAGFSGANTDRPALRQMITDIELGNVDKVLVYKLDRLSRSQKDTLHLIEDIFIPNGVDFVSMNESLDTSTPYGRAMIGILSAFAQLDREQIKERMTMGKDARAKEGKWHGGGTVPIGYDYDEATGELSVNEFEAMQLKIVYEEFLKGTPLKRIENDFIKRGYTHKHGYWSPTTMRRCMANPVYIGYIGHKGERFKGTHEPIIDEATFEKTQKLLKSRRESYETLGISPRVQTSILGGFIYCKQCGARYSRTATRKSKTQPLSVYYTCYSRSNKVKAMVTDPSCRNKNWRAEELDKLVLDEIRKLSLDPEYVETLKNAPKSDEIINKVQIIKEQIRSLEKQISRFMDLYALSNMSLDAVKSKIDPLNEQKRLLEIELEELKPSDIITVEEVREIVKDFGDVIERGDLNETRLLIESLINKIELDENEVTIHWKFA